MPFECQVWCSRAVGLVGFYRLFRPHLGSLLSIHREAAGTGWPVKRNDESLRENEFATTIEIFNDPATTVPILRSIYVCNFARILRYVNPFRRYQLSLRSFVRRLPHAIHGTSMSFHHAIAKNTKHPAHRPSPSITAVFQVFHVETSKFHREIEWLPAWQKYHAVCHWSAPHRLRCRCCLVSATFHHFFLASFYLFFCLFFSIHLSDHVESLALHHFSSLFFLIFPPPLRPLFGLVLSPLLKSPLQGAAAVSLLPSRIDGSTLDVRIKLGCKSSGAIIKPPCTPLASSIGISMLFILHKQSDTI